MHKLLSLAVLIVLSSIAQAQIYEWRDAQGRLNYSDHPPQGVNARLVKGGTPAPRVTSSEPSSGSSPTESDSPDSASTIPAPPAPDAPKSLAEQELEFRQRRAAEAEAKAKEEHARQQAAERERMCVDQGYQLTALQSGQRVSRFNARGEREYLDDTARAREIERIQKFLKSSCN